MLEVKETRIIKPFKREDDMEEISTNPSRQVNDKSFYKSKTIWFNVLVTLFAILSQTVPELKQYMNAETYAAVMGLVNFVNTVLRLFTNKGIKGLSNVN